MQIISKLYIVCVCACSLPANPCPLAPPRSPRVPQVLCYLGILEYSSELNKKLCAGEHLAPGSEEEVEIRGCSIAAVERVKGCLNTYRKVQKITSAQIDFYLWNLAKNHSNEMEDYPIHSRSVCIQLAVYTHPCSLSFLFI